MKTKNESHLVVTIFLVVVAVILVGLIIAWMTGVFKDKRQDLNNGTEKIDNVVGSIAEFDLIVYDGYTIKGSSLVELIDEMVTKEKEVALVVKTLAGAESSYNYVLSATNDLSGKTGALTTAPTDKKSNNYINPNAGFLGSVIRNKNNDIVGLKFVQSK